MKKLKTKFKFPNFIQNSETNYLTLNQISVNQNGCLKNFLVIDNIFKSNALFFLKFIYSNLPSSEDVSRLLKIKVFYFIKNFSTAFRNFINFKRWIPFNSNLRWSLTTPNYLNIEKLFFEILQKITLKNEKNAPINQIHKNFIFYFSPLNEETYSICSCTDLENLEEYFLLFEVFQIWIKKNYFLNLKDINSNYFSLLLNSNLSLFSNRPDQIFFKNKHIFNFSYVQESLFTKNSNQSFLKFYSVNKTLNQQKFTYTQKIKQIVKIYSSQAQASLISQLTPYILSWTYLFRFKLRKSKWNELDKVLSQFIWRWACRRHPNKSKKWIQSKYFFTLNKQLWFFGQMETHSFLEPRTQDNVNFVYLPFHGQIYSFLHVSEKYLNNSQKNVT
jgi:hypothetical protein